MSLIDSISTEVKTDFAEKRQILSFAEYLEEVEKAPWLHIRSAAQYIKDCFDHFGFYTVQGIAGPITRWKLFDQEFEGGIGKMHGLERTQNKVYSQISAFAQSGKTDKIILLHGPNATAKTTFVKTLTAAMEFYSTTEDGAIYTFNWLFSDDYDKGNLGFEKKKKKKGKSLAHEEPENISFKIRSGLRESPLFLIPKKQRIKFLEAAFKKHDRELPLNSPICNQEMGHKYQSVYSALLDNYHGDWRRVLNHVQIGRIFISKRYRTCAVTIEPQRNVDAQSKALTLERDFDIPINLKRADLHEVYGDLVDGNRGIIEYSDFLKRPIEVNKYLLTTAEEGTITLSSTIAYLDVVLIATANEKQLSMFKRDPDFSSFKGRIEPIQVPYLIQWGKEADIYRVRINNLARGKHVSPHTAEFIGLWAVLTRLRKPQGDHFDNSGAKDIIKRLSVIEKAHLYNSGEPPRRLRDKEKKLLLAELPNIATEFDDAKEEFEKLLGPEYEGRRGASAREIMSMVNDAALNKDHACVTPLALIHEIEKLLIDDSLYDFLRLPSQWVFGSIRELTEEAEAEYQKWIKDEVRDSMNLVPEEEYTRIFDRYILNIKAWKQKEKIENPRTGRLENPDEKFMAEIEGQLGVLEDHGSFRSDTIMRVAQWALENARSGEAPPYHEIFSDLIIKLKESYYQKVAKTVDRIQKNILKHETDEWADLKPDEKQEVETALENLTTKYGYCPKCAKVVLSYLLRKGVLQRSD